MIKSNIIFLVACLAIPTMVMGEITAEFIPLGPTTVTPGTPVTFSINLIPGWESYDSATIVVGTNASGIAFQYTSDDWTNYFSGMHDDSIDPYFYTRGEHGIVVSASRKAGEEYTPITIPLTLGSVTLYTDGLAAGTLCSVNINSGFDSISGLYFMERYDPISGQANIIIIPEPGTLILLGFSLCGLTLRRWNTSNASLI